MDNILQNIPPIQQRVSPETKALGDEYFNQKYRKQAKKLGLKVGDNEFEQKQKIHWRFESEDMTNA